MIARGLTGIVALLATTAMTQAQTPVERGNYLVNTIMTCGNCHTPRGRTVPQFDKALSGGLRFDEPPFDVTASNITPDRTTGIGDWSDADIKNALQEGMRPNGVPLAEVMPSGFYEILTPRDPDAIVAYLRSVPAVSNKVRDPVYKMRYPAPGRPRRREADAGGGHGRQGQARLLSRHHRALHGMPYADRPPGTGVDFGNALGKGGREFHGPWGVSVSRNITSSKAKGIGGWTDAEIKRAITQGVRKDGSKLKPPMGFRLLRQDDRRRSRRHGRLSAHGAGEGVTAARMARRAGRHHFFLRTRSPDRVVEVDRREIVGHEIGRGGLRRRLVQRAASAAAAADSGTCSAPAARRRGWPARPCPAAAQAVATAITSPSPVG